MDNRSDTEILEEILAVLQSKVDAEHNAARFFKTTPGSYSAGDVFLGIRMPVLRMVVKDFKHVSFEVIKELLSSPFNEARLLGLLILVERYSKSKVDKDKIYEFYLQNLGSVNNWNLVDSSAHLIIGVHLLDKDKSLLEKLARSDNLWERRIAIVSTWWFIRKKHLDTTFHLAKILLADKHDLIHKAVGWMLREAGEKDEKMLLDFLNIHASIMPRTMLRYALEKIKKEDRDRLMKL